MNHRLSYMGELGKLTHLTLTFADYICVVSHKTGRTFLFSSGDGASARRETSPFLPYFITEW